MITCERCGWEYDPDNTCCRCEGIKKNAPPVKIVKPKKKQ